MKIRFALMAVTLAMLAGLVLGIRDSKLEQSTAFVRDAVVQHSAESIPKKATFVFVGDIMLARYVAKYRDAHEDPVWPFRNVLGFLQEADMTFGNLESVISDAGSDARNLYSFRAHPKMLAGLLAAGFDAVSVVNNHSLDWGREAFFDSSTRLRKADIRPVANEVEVFEAGGFRIGIYAYTDLLQAEGVNSFDVDRVVPQIGLDKERLGLDYSIVSFHWGNEYETTSSASQRYIAHSLVDAGADIVVGHHPHVAQEYEWYNRSLILYSLGNFVFDQNFSEETMRGLVARVGLSEERIEPEFFVSYINKEYQVEKIEPLAILNE